MRNEFEFEITQQQQQQKISERRRERESGGRERAGASASASTWLVLAMCGIHLWSENNERTLQYVKDNDGVPLETVGPLRVRSDSFRNLISTSVGGHVQLMRTGDIAITQEYWSPTVFVSCAAYSLPGFVYAASAWWWMTTFYVFVTYFSVQADSISPHSRFYNAADRVCATIGLLICPVRVTLLNECSAEFRVAVWSLFLMCFAVLTWSRQSANSKQFVFRHSLWHALSIMALSWLAWRETHGTVNQPVLSSWAAGEL